MHKNTVFKKFYEGVQYKPFGYDHTIGTITKIISLADPYYLIIDSSFFLHIAKNPALKPNPQLIYPIPSYGLSTNPKVLYTIEWEQFYEAVFKKKMDFVLHERLIEAVSNDADEPVYPTRVIKVNENSVLIQMDFKVPVVQIDFRYPEKFKIFNELTDIFNLQEAFDNSIFFFKSKEIDSMKNVLLWCHLDLKKSKRLNFDTSQRSDESGIFYLKEGVVVYSDDASYQFLNFKTNKIFRKISKHNSFQYSIDPVTSFFWYYMGDDIIHFLEFKNGGLLDERKIILEESHRAGYNRLRPLHNRTFVSVNHTGFKFYSMINWNLKAELITATPGQAGKNCEIEYRCCDLYDEASKKEHIIYYDNKESFYLRTTFCRKRTHGLQKIHFCKFARNPQTNAYEFINTEIFSEYRDPVAALTVFQDKKKGLFITERARLFEFDLRTYKIKLLAVIDPLLEAIISGKSIKGEIKHLYAHSSPDLVFIGILSRNTDRIICYNFNISSFKTSRVFESLSVHCVVQNSPKIAALTFNTVAHHNPVGMRLKFLDGDTTVDTHANFNDKCPVELYAIFKDLYVISDEDNRCLYLYDENLKFIGTEDLEPILDLEEDEDDEEEISITNIVPVSNSYYLVHVCDILEKIVVCTRSGMIRVLKSNIRKFMYRFGNHLFFTDIDEFMSPSITHASSILKPKSIKPPPVTQIEMNKEEEEKNEEEEQDNYSEVSYNGDEIEKKNYDLKPKHMCAIDPFEVYLGYETYINRNSICIFKTYDAKMELLRVLDKQLRDLYHTYTIKMVYESLWMERFEGGVVEEDGKICRTNKEIKKTKNNVPMVQPQILAQYFAIPEHGDTDEDDDLDEIDDDSDSDE